MLNYIWCPNGPTRLYIEQFHLKSVITFLILMNQIRRRCHKNYQHKLVLDVPVI
jgi:hypothetical protein